MYKIIGADQKEYGPISADQLRQWISEGRVNAQTRVRIEGADNWTTAGQLPEFAAAVPAPNLAAITMPPSLVRKNNAMAIWSFVLGILTFPCCGGVLGPVALVLGIISLIQVKHNPQETGGGFAIAGIVLGALGTLELILVLLAVALGNSADFMQNLQNMQNQFPH